MHPVRFLQRDHTIRVTRIDDGEYAGFYQPPDGSGINLKVTRSNGTYTPRWPDKPEGHVDMQQLEQVVGILMDYCAKHNINPSP